MNYSLLNDEVKCTDCTYADSWGRDCKHGLMFPIGVFLSGNPCPNFKRKTSEQIEQQLQVLKPQ